MLGSTEPERVPIIMPSSGVKPMLVSTLLPFSTAVTDAPFPRWQTISRDEFGGNAATARPRAAWSIER